MDWPCSRVVLRWTPGPCSLSFQVQEQDQTQVSKRIIYGLVPIICSRKLDFCIYCHGKCCFRPKMQTCWRQL